MSSENIGGGKELSIWNCEDAPLNWSFVCGDFHKREVVSLCGMVIEAWTVGVPVKNVDRVLRTAALGVDTMSSMLDFKSSYKTLRIVEVPYELTESYHCGNLLISSSDGFWLLAEPASNQPDWLSYEVNKLVAAHWWDEMLNPVRAPGYGLFTEGLPGWSALEMIRMSQGDVVFNQALLALRHNYELERVVEAGVEPSPWELDSQSYASSKNQLFLNQLAESLSPGHLKLLLRDFYKLSLSGEREVTAASLKRYLSEKKLGIPLDNL